VSKSHADAHLCRCDICRPEKDCAGQQNVEGDILYPLGESLDNEMTETRQAISESQKYLRETGQWVAESETELRETEDQQEESIATLWETILSGNATRIAANVKKEKALIFQWKEWLDQRDEDIARAHITEVEKDAAKVRSMTSRLRWVIGREKK
jgi:hypothetical protein